MRRTGVRRKARRQVSSGTVVPAFDPITIATAYWKASDTKNAGGSAASNGEKSASAINRVNPGTHDLSQAVDGTRPTFTASSINGKPAWSHAATQYLSADSLAALVTGEDVPFTMFVVARHLTDANTESAMVAFGNSGSATPFIAMKYRSDAANRQAEYQHRDGASNLLARQSAGAFATGDFLYEFYVDPAAMRVLLNGTSVSGPHDNTGQGTTTLNTFSVGALRRNTVVFPSSSIEICEVLFASSALSSDNRAAYRAYVTSEYGIVTS